MTDEPRNDDRSANEAEQAHPNRPVMPPDPAGSQPKVDHNSLLPERLERVEAPPPFTPPVAPIADAESGVVATDAAEPPHAAKFQFILGALIAIGIVGLASLFLVAGSGREETASTWSPWKPTENGNEGAQQIADHVGPQYRLPTGEQLVLVVGGPMKVQDLPMDVVMRDTKGDVKLVEGDAVLYKLCGLGDKCSIAKGEPSQERHLLLRREALELALYSFRYLRGIDQVVVQMPPPPGEEPSQALFFQKGDVDSQLDAPLRATLPVPAPTVKNVAKTRDAALVNQITTRGLFKFTYTQAQDARVYMVLEPREAGVQLSQDPPKSPSKSSGAAGSSGSKSGGSAKQKTTPEKKPK